MRKLAPAFILTSIVALTSGSALAFGDMNRSKKSPSTETSSQMAPSSSSSYTTPASAPAPKAGVEASPTVANDSTSATGKDKSKMKKKQVAQNDGRCDSSTYLNRNDLPKDCLEKSGTGAGTSSSVNAAPGESSK